MADPIALRQPMPVERRHWTRASGLGLIAAVLILVATVAIISAPDSESDPPRLPAIAAASPASTATRDPGAPSASVQIVPDGHRYRRMHDRTTATGHGRPTAGSTRRDA